MPDDHIGKRIAAWRKSARFSQARLARELGIHRNTIIGYEQEGEVPENRIAALKLMGFDPAAEYKKDLPVISGPAIGVTYPTYEMPYVGYLPAGTWAEPSATEDTEEVEAKHWRKDRYCARMEGFSCFPALQPGDFTMWDPTPAPPVGKIVVARRLRSWNGAEVTMR